MRSDNLFTKAISLVRTLTPDLRYAVRSLWKSPAQSLLAVVILSLGIGASTAIFSLVDVVLFRPLPIAKPGELVRITEGQTKHAAEHWAFVSFPRYLGYRNQSSVFSGLAAYVDRFPVNLSGAHLAADRVDAGMITGNYFQTLGVGAYIGRAILPEDDVPGAAPVVMLSYSYWRKHFQFDRGVLGRSLIVDGQPFTVVGVTPRGFGGVSFENLPEVWLPMAYAFQVDPLLRVEIPHQDEAFVPFGVVGRLKPGVLLSEAQAQLDVVGANLGAGTPDLHGRNFKRPWPVLVPAATAARGGRTALSVLSFSIVVLFLLIACADVSGLLLARSEARQKG